MSIKNIKGINFRNVLCISILLFIYSCGSNTISFDEKKQVIISECNISKIIIENLKTSDIVIVKSKMKHKKYLLSLNKMDTVNFIYFKDWLENKKLDDFTIQPNTKYKIENASIGDASNFGLTLEANEEGELKISH
ncbi:hypothetical protein H1R17_06265 [Flavobacterium sp. xlx-214]|uniref:hypothetical protein n=1 Tax=unclassified Flavobacterium TaxID=196869 RepID=UPI0013CFE038|nr:MULTISPECIES: hypothetical protein [unclassified Flavobacterium]MBA5792944.1 hypothetical protein [Flavobacterium sp. xlx-221]QMI84722.1 hypothetical protein H1R17_06265 [Flavobacterium sp. xlx-214]